MTEKRNPPRRYDASTRQEAAHETRRAILKAARELFLERGYAKSSMATIAGRAGVHIDTIYEAVGRKPELVRLLLESAISGEDGEVPALERDYVRDMRAEPDARRKLALYAAATCDIQERLQPIHRVIQEAAASEPALAALWMGIAERRSTNMRLLVADLARAAPLRHDLPPEQAADVIWSTNGPEFYTLLVIERGWRREQFEAWLAETWARLLLAPGD